MIDEHEYGKSCNLIQVVCKDRTVCPAPTVEVIAGEG